MRTIIFMAAFTAGNYVTQYMAAVPNWEIAFERSFFQIVAIVTYLIYMRFTND